jgi:hypothetical protein
MNQKSNVNFVILQFDLFVLQFDLFVLNVLQIESMDDSLLYSKSIITFLVPLLSNVHLFGDLSLSTPMTTTPI